VYVVAAAGFWGGPRLDVRQSSRRAAAPLVPRRGRDGGAAAAARESGEVRGCQRGPLTPAHLPERPSADLSAAVAGGGASGLAPAARGSMSAEPAWRRGRQLRGSGQHRCLSRQ
jgi:hypothetical protein